MLLGAYKSDGLQPNSVGLHPNSGHVTGKPSSHPTPGTSGPDRGAVQHGTPGRNEGTHGRTPARDAELAEDEAWPFRSVAGVSVRRRKVGQGGQHERHNPETMC